MAVIGGTEICASFRIGASSVVASINGLTGAVILAAGTGITLTPAGNTITIASTGITGSGSAGQVAIFNGSGVLISSAGFEAVGASIQIGNIGAGPALIQFLGTTSGAAAIGVAAIAGSSNLILLPLASGTIGQVLSTDGNSPQQTSWISAVTSLNGLTGAVIFAAGSGVTLTPVGNTVTIASAGLAATGVVQVAAVQLSAAQMLALATTPVTLIAAPGSGFAIIPIHVGFREHFVSAAYVVTGANLSILYANGQSPANGMGSFGSGTGVLDQTSSRSRMFAATASSGITVNSNADNQALQVQNVGTAYTTGDGLVTFVVDYMIVPSSL